ncbi:hypothetical protein HUJ04_007431 [Dendroctonus ponderosae]
MGSVTSKSPLERRNTVARRSQRRTLYNLKPKIDRLNKDIKKFKGITEDVTYVSIKNEIEYYKNDLARKGKDLQPQVRTVYEDIYKRINEAEAALQSKLEDNREKQEKKDAKQKENGGTAQSEIDSGEVLSEVNSNLEDAETVVQVHTDHENTDTQRKTVEIKLIKVVSDEAEPKSPKEVRIISPAEKRKSILKVGVPVMPGAIMNEMSAQSLRSNKQNYELRSASPKSADAIFSRIKDIVENLRNVELEINDFIGTKNGKQYNKIRETLNMYLVELNGITHADQDVIDQIKVCRNYIVSCLNFLDEKATNSGRPESFTSDDEVFENNNVQPVSKVEANFKLQKLLRNTAV